MKIRSDFVTNSSSSSFVIGKGDVGFSRKILDKFLKQVVAEKECSGQESDIYIHHIFWEIGR